MLTAEDYNRLEADLALCKSCGRDFGARSNKGIRTCDGCGTLLRPIPIDILKKVVVHLAPDPKRRLHRGTIFGWPYHGIGR